MFEVYLNKGSGTKFYKEALQNYNYSKNQYLQLQEKYDKDIATYPERLQKAKNTEIRCKNDFISDEVWCKQKYGGFFGN